MSEIYKFTCKPCCGRYFTVPCCGLVGKCLELTIICPSTGTNVNGIPFTGQTRKLCSDVPVFYNPNYFGQVIDETAIWWDKPFFLNNNPEPCSYSFLNYTYKLKCIKTVCDIDYPWGPTPYPFYNEPCSEIHYNPDAINYPNYYTLTAGSEQVSPFFILKRATSCNPFYWEYTWNYPVPNTNPGYWSTFANGTKFIITEGPCCGQGSGGSTSGGTTSGSSGSVFPPSGSTPSTTYTVYWKVCDPYGNQGIPTCLSQTYPVGQPAIPPTGYASVVGPFTTSGECMGTYMNPCPVGWTPPPDPGPASGSTSGSTPGSTTGPTSGPMESFPTVSGGSTAPGSTASSGGGSAPGSTPPQSSGPWMIL